MSPFQLSTLAWVGGGAAGAALSKDRRVLGAVIGALTVGAISDSMIERKQQQALTTGATITGVGLIAFVMIGLSLIPAKA